MNVDCHAEISVTMQRSDIRISSCFDDVQTTCLLTEIQNIWQQDCQHAVVKSHGQAKALSSSWPVLSPAGRTRRILWTISPRSRGHSWSRSEHLTHVQTWPQFRNSTVDCKTQRTTVVHKLASNSIVQ